MLKNLACIIISFILICSSCVAFANTSWMPAVNYYLLSSGPSVVPKITGQRIIIFNEEQPFQLKIEHFIISDQDSTAFTIKILPGSNYQIFDDAIQPATNFYGELKIPVQVSDGNNTSGIFTATVQVQNVNDVPMVKQYSINVNNVEPINILFSDLFTDADSPVSIDNFKLNINQKDQQALTTNSGTFDRQIIDGKVYFTFTAAAGFAGVQDLSYWVTDETGAPSNAGLFKINVTNSVRPRITAQSTIQMQEDTSIQLSASQFSIVDYDSSSHTIVPQSGQNYTVNGTNIVPRKDFFGTLTIPVVASDGVNTSPVFISSIKVQNVNDAPVALMPITIYLKQDGSSIFHLTGLFHDVDGVNENTIFYLLSDGADCSVSCRLKNGRITRTSNHPWASHVYAPDAGFFGVDYIQYSIKDSSGAVSSMSRLMFDVSQKEIFKITGQNLIQMNEDSTLKLEPSHFVLTGTPADTVVSITPLPGTNYTLTNNTVVPNRDFTGELSVEVIANAGSTTSGVFNAKVTVLNVNDRPVMGAAVKRFSGAANQTIPNVLIQELFTDADLTGSPLNYSGYSVQLVDKTHSTAGVTANGKLIKTGSDFASPWTYTPNPGFSGQDTVKVWVTDSSGLQADSPATLVFDVQAAAVPSVQRFEWVAPQVSVSEMATFHWDIRNVQSCTAMRDDGTADTQVRQPSGTSGPWLYMKPLVRQTRWFCKDLNGNRYPTNPGQFLTADQKVLIAPASTITVEPANRAQTGPFDLTLKTTIPHSELRYTLDGTDVTSTSPLYTGSVNRTVNTTVKARTFYEGVANSEQAVVSFVIQSNVLNAPEISPNGGSFNDSVNVCLTITPGAEVRYSIDGSDVTTNSKLYSACFSLNTSATVKAKAFKAGLTDSVQSMASFVINTSGPVEYIYDTNGRLIRTEIVR